MKNIIIIGAGGFAREVAWLIERINAVEPTYKILGYLDDKVENLGKKIGNYQVIGCIEDIKTLDKPISCTLAVGSADVKKSIYNRIRDISGLDFPNLIDPSVIISDNFQMGMGNIICAGCILTVDFTLGNFVTINLDSTVGHDAIIDDYVTIYPSVNISGNVHLEECSEVGTGSAIIQGLNVGHHTIIGAGSVVIRNLDSNGVAVGNPAKIIKSR